eukprot:8417204-Pyramimonas_sp.AAC.1
MPRRRGVRTGRTRAGGYASSESTVLNRRRVESARPTSRFSEDVPSGILIFKDVSSESFNFNVRRLKPTPLEDVSSETAALLGTEEKVRRRVGQTDG